MLGNRGSCCGCLFCAVPRDVKKLLKRHSRRVDMLLLLAAHFGDDQFLERKDAGELLAEGGDVTLFEWALESKAWKLREGRLTQKALERVSTVSAANWLVSVPRLRVNDECLVRACASGSFELVEFFCSMGSNPRGRTFEEAARFGVRMLQMLWDRVLQPNNYVVYGCEACDRACEKGDLTALKWLHERRFPITSKTCCVAAAGGHINCLDFIIYNTPVTLNNPLIAAGAAEGGHLDTLEWLHEHGATLGLMVAMNASERGHVKLLQFYDQIVPPSPSKWSKLCCASAAKNNHLECLNFLRFAGCQWNAQTASEAAANGHFGLLRLLHAEGCPVDRHAIVMAIADGNYDTVRWVLEKKFVLPAKAGSVAAQRGDTYILQLMHDAGFQFGPDACLSACSNGKLVALEWLRNHQCPYDKEACLSVSNLFPKIRDFLEKEA